MPRMALVSEGTKNQSQSLNAVWDCILPGEKKKTTLEFTSTQSWCHGLG